ncbi:MAG: hypothetical protein JNM17_17530 [Archangium sp.]|nr:hypothetical protein [Archangium sp.]
MTLPTEVVANIRRLHFAEHWKVGTIATQLGVHHDAVERALGLKSLGLAAKEDSWLDMVLRTSEV